MFVVDIVVAVVIIGVVYLLLLDLAAERQAHPYQGYGTGGNEGTEFVVMFVVIVMGLFSVILAGCRFFHCFLFVVIVVCFFIFCCLLLLLLLLLSLVVVVVVVVVIVC